MTDSLSELEIDDLLVPSCVHEYRARNKLAYITRKVSDIALSEYVNVVYNLADILAQGFTFVVNEDDEVSCSYSNLIGISLDDEDSIAESILKCERYMKRICDIAIQLNEYIYDKSEIIFSFIHDWCKVHEKPLTKDLYARTLYHFYFLTPILVESIVDDNKVVNNIIHELRSNVNKSSYKYTGDYINIWSEYKEQYPNYLVAPDTLIGVDLQIPAFNSTLVKHVAYQTLKNIIPEKGIISIIDDYIFCKIKSDHFLDVMMNALRNDYESGDVVYDEYDIRLW